VQRLLTATRNVTFLEKSYIVGPYPAFHTFLEKSYIVGPYPALHTFLVKKIYIVGKSVQRLLTATRNVWRAG
jgi:hypothetical protein